MDLAIISLIVVLTGLFLVPIYSSYVMEWRIKKYVKKFKISDIAKALIILVEEMTGKTIEELTKDE